MSPAFGPKSKSLSKSRKDRRIVYGFCHSVNAGTARFEEVEILGIPALFTTLRVDRATVPKGMYAYDMQTDAEDWSQPCLLARRVLVEHFGTVLTASPIHLPEKGYLDLSPGNFKEQGIGQLTVAEFEAKQLSPDYQLSRPWSAAKRRHSPVLNR